MISQIEHSKMFLWLSMSFSLWISRLCWLNWDSSLNLISQMEHSKMLLWLSLLFSWWSFALLGSWGPGAWSFSLTPGLSICFLRMSTGTVSIVSLTGTSWWASRLSELLSWTIWMCSASFLSSVNTFWQIVQWTCSTLLCDSEI